MAAKWDAVGGNDWINGLRVAVAPRYLKYLVEGGDEPVVQLMDPVSAAEESLSQKAYLQSKVAAAVGATWGCSAVQDMIVNGTLGLRQLSDA